MIISTDYKQVNKCDYMYKVSTRVFYNGLFIIFKIIRFRFCHSTYVSISHMPFSKGVEYIQIRKLRHNKRLY